MRVVQFHRLRELEPRDRIVADSDRSLWCGCRAVGAEAAIALPSWTPGSAAPSAFDPSDFGLRAGEPSNSGLPAVMRNPVGGFGIIAYYHHGVVV